MAAFVFIRHRH